MVTIPVFFPMNIKFDQIFKLHQTIYLLFIFCLSAWSQIDTLNFIKGADVSFLAQIEDSGGVYKDENIAMDALDIFKKYDFNYIRLKLWHTPEENYNNRSRILQMAKRIKIKGFKFIV